jgi:hypothetical protein
MKPSAILTPNSPTPTPAPTAEPEPVEPEPTVTPTPTPEPRTLKKFLQIALQPVGTTMYIYGGGWNEDDTAAGPEALTIGLSQRWIDFAKKQDSTYNHRIHRYEIHNGLDCTGFIGWAIFNLMPNSTGYVFWSDGCAKSLSDYGLGSFTKRANVKVHQTGDIMSTEGHAWISLGEASDKSVVILHASPPGTALWGTQTGSKTSGAAKLADEYMAKYFPSWHAKYPQVAKTDRKYVTSYDQFKWDPSILPDPDGYREMPVEDMLKDLFEGMEPK